MREHERPDYPARTRRNVEVADGTLILGSVETPGCSLTLRICIELEKTVLVIPRDHELGTAQSAIRGWLREEKIVTLNVAGNREELNPGIGAWAESLLMTALGPHD
jgi:Circularly permutated YpsA SLOG family